MLSDNQRLYDISIRLALYVERVKYWQVAKFNHVLKNIKTVLRELFSRINYNTLDGLSKAKLNKLLIDLRKSQTTIYSEYIQDLIKDLQLFMQANLIINRQVWTSVNAQQDKNNTFENNIVFSDEEAIKYIEKKKKNPLFGLAVVTGNDDRLWSSILNSPSPANGLYLIPFLKTFQNSAQASVENIIRKGWANNASVDDVLTELIGSGQLSQSATSQIKKIQNQNSAVINTSMADISQLVSAAVASSVFEKYAWYSVIDNRTTWICISRNLKVYYYGKGPVPPAHVNCRSTIGPVQTENDTIDENFYDWFDRQPEEIQNEFSEDFDKKTKKFVTKEPLTFEEFKGKIKTILIN